MDVVRCPDAIGCGVSYGMMDMDQTAVCAPLTLRPTSAATASIDATDSGLIVGEWNAPNGRRKYSLGIDTYCGCVAVMTKYVAEQHWKTLPRIFYTLIGSS
jgi:hypothetical protein